MKVISEDDPRLEFVPLEKATIPPPGLIEHIHNRWWVVHPQKGLVFWKGWSPQCNSNKEITERIWKGMYPWAEIQFIPSVYRRINPNDYVC